MSQAARAGNANLSTHEWFGQHHRSIDISATHHNDDEDHKSEGPYDMPWMAKDHEVHARHLVVERPGEARMTGTPQSCRRESIGTS